jgi:dTDP-4-dehydrorhamnose reductase
MKRILIIGSKGMAGHVIYNYFKENTNFEISDIARDTNFHTPKYQLDVSDFSRLTDAIDKEKPEVVINCIGILNQDAETNPDKAILFNSYLPHFLARLGDKNAFKLIHISTDCVFNGKIGGYTEMSIKDGIGFYAQTKALGEVTYGNNLTIRTSIIGPELKNNGIGLLHWFLMKKANIDGYTEAFWSGVTTLQLAKSISLIIEQNELCGLIHLTNNVKISKFELLNLFKTFFNKKVIVIPNNNYKVDKSLLSTRSDVTSEVPSYTTMISELSKWMLDKKFLYTHYELGE